MCMLYKFLKRNSPLFVPQYGGAGHIKEHYAKFLCNRYGEVKHYYNPNVEIAVIEADIRKLLDEEYSEDVFRTLLNPPDNFV
jgi:glutathione peroxidase-family protein